MAWRKPTNEDLVATLSQVEVDGYKSSPEFENESDPVERILDDTAEFVRGYCRRLENKGSLKIHPEDGYIPSGLMNVAMDIAAYRVLKRFNIPLTDARKDAYNAAIEQLRDVADGKMFPESYESEDDGVLSASGIVPLTAMSFRPDHLD